MCEGWKGECVRGGRGSVWGVEERVCEGWKGECEEGVHVCRSHVTLLNMSS